MATLIITDGPAHGQQFALSGHRLVLIGRHEQCTFQVLDPQISRKHLQVRWDPDTEKHVALDAGSANGVLLNGVRLEQEIPLADGDIIHIGDTSIAYCDQDTPDAATVNSLLRKRGEHMKPTIGD